jgi:hypothetical protein
MLYIGAGYDLSPLLSFAPGGPPYPIIPLSQQDSSHTEALTTYEHDTYRSFLFVDAKPRYTSAYMVADFDEWKTVEARVRSATDICPLGLADSPLVSQEYPLLRPRNTVQVARRPGGTRSPLV